MNGLVNGATMPLLDWQFWVVTLAMLWSAWVVARQFLPKKGAPACGGCAAGSAACAKPRAAAEAADEGDEPLVHLGVRRSGLEAR